MNAKKLLAAGAVIAALLLGAGAAAAQDAPGRQGGRVAKLTREMAQIVAEATGLEPRELLAQYRDGQSLAEIIAAQGGDVEAVSAQIVTALTERANTAAAEGQITQVRADQLIENLDDLVARVLDSDNAGRAADRLLSRGVMHLAAEETGLSRQQIAEQLQAGKSLATVLTENGVDVNAFVDDTVSRLGERLTKQVEAGRITQERADALLQTARDRLLEGINRVPGAENAGG